MSPSKPSLTSRAKKPQHPLNPKPNAGVMHKDLKPENVMMASPRKAPLEAAGIDAFGVLVGPRDCCFSWIAITYFVVSVCVFSSSSTDRFRAF